MRKQVVPYPRLNTHEALKNIGARVDWSFSDRGRPLSSEEIAGGHVRITDKVWYPGSCPLTVSFVVQIQHPIRLFSDVVGNEKSNVADRRSLLGVALRWKMPRTNLQGAFQCQDVTFRSKGEIRFSGSISFPESVIRFALDLEVVLYLKSPCETTAGVYAKSAGAILGSLDHLILFTGGSGGYFPTVTESVLNGPLWRVYTAITEAEDFNEDFTDEKFCLILNEAHPLFDQVYVTSREGRLYVSPLMFEIFVNACCVLIRKACQYIPDRSWDLERSEKDEETVYVNFKAFKRACLPDFSRKEILEMELENLFQNVRLGIAKFIQVDLGEKKK